MLLSPLEKNVLLHIYCFFFRKDWRRLNSLGSAYYQKKKYKDAIKYHEKALRPGGLNDKSLSLLDRAKRELRWDLPPIMLNTVEKSGSVFIRQALVRGLGMPKGSIDVREIRWPLREVSEDLLKEKIEDRCVIQGHFFPYTDNIAVFSRNLDKIILNFRDPRASTLSYYHHVNKREELRHYENPLPDKYWEMSEEEKLNYQIEHYIPSVIKWINMWKEIENNKDYNIRFLWTTCEELVRDPDGLFKRILDFYEIQHERFAPPLPPKIGVNNFRKGDNTEWQRVFSSAQKERCRFLIPDEFFDEYGWTR